MKRLQPLLLVLPLVCALGQDNQPKDPPRDTVTSPAPKVRGMALPLHSLDPEFDYNPWIRELPGLGVNSVCLGVKLFQEQVFC